MFYFDPTCRNAWNGKGQSITQEKLKKKACLILFFLKDQ